MLTELMAELCTAKVETLMVGDTSHDMEMARAAGVDALAVTYGAHPEAGLRACAPLECLSSVRELTEWLRTNA
jgi:phosphoglycolate phosphatase